MKAIVAGIAVVGCLLMVYGAIAESSAGGVGLALAVVSIVLAAFVERGRPPRSERDERGAKAAVIASILGNQ